MEYRELIHNGDRVSLLGFGFMRLPIKENDPSKIDDKTAFEMVDYAISKGINYFDTAYMYHDGMSELFVSRALKKYPRDSYFLADKLPLWSLKSIDDVQSIFDEQLRKCGVEYFDYYLMHAMAKGRFEKAVKLGIYDKLKEYQRQGRIRNLGFSFHDTPEVLETMLTTYDWDFVQLQINYLDWELQNARKQYELVEAKGIKCIVMEPVRGGALADLCPEANDILKQFSPERSIASWAVRYAASLPNVLTVLSGMSDFSQVKDNIGSMNPFSPLSDKEKTVLQNALDTYKKTQTLPCTSCRYCMDCDFGVDIPRVFEILNSYSLTKDSYAAASAVKGLAGEKHPSNCTECGSCAIRCPQSIEIPAQMKRASNIFKELSQ
ncbi:MAG: Fe-S oxidoreductase [Firmicutes bacterium HGW-Firmicutes-21]|nr:MAG: Fe-S oxidoreductase [Firmicutes bacterium HGW-Firmicutes-21]